MKSMMRRPFEKRPVGWWKNVSPYGGNAAAGRSSGSERPIKFPVSAVESPKLMMDLKFRQCVSELTTIVRKRVDKKKLRSFFVKCGGSGDAMRESWRLLALRHPLSQFLLYFVFFLSNKTKIIIVFVLSLTFNYDGCLSL